jgi:predicted RNA-binding Zn-ribbon protein involved in translation (DUF1610 family)
VIVTTQELFQKTYRNFRKMTKDIDYSCPECGADGKYKASDRHRSYYECDIHGKYTVFPYD